MLYPIHRPFSGIVDNNGNASIPIPSFQTAAWSSIFVTVEQSVNLNGTLVAVGNPFWSMQIDQNKAAYGTGSATEIGPRLVPPKSNITINMSNGNPGAVVNGILQGSYSTSPNASELMINHKPNINPISINTSPAPLENVIGTGPINSGLVAHFSPLPTGTTYLILSISPNGPLTATISGAITSTQYYQETFISQYGVFPFLSLPVIRIIPVDPLIDNLLILTNLGPGNILGFSVSTHTDPVPAEATSDQGMLYIFPIQAVSIAASAVLSVIPQPTNLNTVWNLENYSLFQDGSQAAGHFIIQDTNTPTANVIHDMQSTSTRGLLDRGSFGGVAVKAGQGIGILNSSVGAAFVGGFITARSCQMWGRGDNIGG